MKKVISVHCLAIIFAFILGILMVLPTISSIGHVGFSNFKGIYPLLSDDEDHYLTMIREVSDGHIKMSNPYIAEYKSEPYTQPFLADLYYYGFARIFGITVNLSALINDFILPFLSFLLLYLFLFRLSNSIKVATFFTSTYFLFFLELFNRPVNPQFSFIFLLCGLNLIRKIVFSKNNIKNIFKYNILLAFTFGVLVYVYPFYWMTLLVLYILLTLSVFILDRDYKYLFLNWAIFGLPALLSLLPFLSNFSELKKSPLFEETTIRNGYIFTHIPGAFLSIAPLFIPIILLVYFFLFSKNNENKNFNLLFISSLIVAGFGLNWQNIITGLTIQFTSHLYPVMVLFSIIIAVFSITFFEEKNEQIIGGKKLVYVLVAISLFSILFLQGRQLLHSFKIIYSPIDMERFQKIAEPIFWLQKNIEKDSTIFTLGDEYDWAIPIYTSGNVYFTNYAGVFLMSNNELEQRWSIKHFFDNVDRSVVYGNRDIWLDRFIDTYQSKEVRRKILEKITGKKYKETELMDEASIEKVLNTHNAFKKIGFERSLKTFKADYVMLNYTDIKYKDAYNKLSTYKFLSKVYSDDMTVIYKVK